MPAEFHINTSDEIVTLRLQGDVMASELRACVTTLLADPDFDPALPQLIDMREAVLQHDPGTSQGLERFLLHEYQPRIAASVAVVVNREWGYDLCAWVYLMCCSLQRAEVFDDWNQACKWLIRREFAPNYVPGPVAIEGTESRP